MASTHYDTRPEGGMKLKITAEGRASLAPQTVMTMLKECVAKHGTRKALCVKRASTPDSEPEWLHWTWQQYYDDCQAAAKSLIKLGLERFHSVAIIGFNSPEWFMADVGAIMAGGFAAGVCTLPYLSVAAVSPAIPTPPPPSFAPASPQSPPISSVPIHTAHTRRPSHTPS